MTVSKIKIANGGPEFSRIALGLWRLADAPVKSKEETLTILKAALQAGITTFDQADIYGDYSSEEIFGSALSLEPGLRNQMQIISKCGIKLLSKKRPEHKIKSYDTSKEHITKSVENTLKAIRTDRLDVLLLHRPDPLMDPDEVAETFGELKQSGKVLHFGVSNFTASQFDLLQSRLDYPLVTNQIEVSVQCFEPMISGILDHCMINRISPMAWSPLGGGKLFQKVDPETVRIQTVLHETHLNHQNSTIDQILLAWLLMHPSRIVPVIGSGNTERIYSAAQSEQIKLSREEWFKIYSAAMGRNVP